MTSTFTDIGVGLINTLDKDTKDDCITISGTNTGSRFIIHRERSMNNVNHCCANDCDVNIDVIIDRSPNANSNSFTRTNLNDISNSSPNISNEPIINVSRRMSNEILEDMFIGAKPQAISSSTSLTQHPKQATYYDTNTTTYYYRLLNDVVNELLNDDNVDVSYHNDVLSMSVRTEALFRTRYIERLNILHSDEHKFIMKNLSISPTLMTVAAMVETVHRVQPNKWFVGLIHKHFISKLHFTINIDVHVCSHVLCLLENRLSDLLLLEPDECLSVSEVELLTQLGNVVL